jgi:hypothetical protein
VKPGDKYLECGDCGYVVQLAQNSSPLQSIGRHTTARHDRRPSAAERTPRIAS